MALSTAIKIYESTEQLKKSEPLIREFVEHSRVSKGDDSAPYAANLVALGRNLLRQKRHAEAEKPRRAALAINSIRAPDDWRTFSLRRIVGLSLLGQEQYGEAEPLMVAGYEGMKQREEQIPPAFKSALDDALKALVQLYEACDKPEQAAKWRTKLPAAKSTGDTKP